MLAAAACPHRRCIARRSVNGGGQDAGQGNEREEADTGHGSSRFDEGGTGEGTDGVGKKLTHNTFHTARCQRFRALTSCLGVPVILTLRTALHIPP